MATLNLFPARVRFVNDDGTLTPEAYRTLQVLSQRVGGPLGDNGRDVFGDITGVAALDLSIMDTVMQPTAAQTLVDMVQQPVGVADFMPDVVQPPNEAVSFDLAAAIHAAPSKTTPVDADEMPLADSASGFKLRRLTWANLKAAMQTYLSGIAFPIGGVVQAAGLFTLAKGIRSGQIDYSTAGLESQSSAGDVHISLHAAGVSATSIKHVRGASGIEIISTDGLTPANLKAGVITTVGGAVIQITSTSLTNGAGVSAGTITNAPAVGNPTKWIGINDNGTIRYIPSW